MTKVVWVAEKKSLADAVIKAIGGEVEKSSTHQRIGNHFFVWLDGHAFKQAMPDYYLPKDVPLNTKGNKLWRKEDLPIIPSKWVIIPDENKMPRLKKLSELLKQCDLVYHLGDPDEEGQLLVDEALQYFRNSLPVKRILVNDYNPAKIKEAIANIKSNDDPLFRGWSQWALARSHYDWIFGLNCTRAMTLRGRDHGYNGVLSVGSVQTPLLNIVRERDRQIESFKPVPYYTIHAQILHKNGIFIATWKPSENQSGLDESDRLIDESIANAMASNLSNSDAKIIQYAKQKKAQHPPLPPSMNELQIEGFKRYKYTGEQVLEACQRLYEVYKLTTYPRSDNRYLSEVQHREAPQIIQSVLSLRPEMAVYLPSIDANIKSSAFNDKKMEGTPHHAVVPTIPESIVDVSRLSEIERNMYDLIVRWYLALFAKPYEYFQTSITVDIKSELFFASGQTPISQGWRSIFNEVLDDETEGDNIKQDNLPSVSEGDPAFCKSCKKVDRKTKAPPRFDDRLLLEAMINLHKYVTDINAKSRLKEGDGIGTTATRAKIISDLKERKLLVPVKAGSSKIMTSEAARNLIDALPKDVKDPTQAGVLKGTLDRVGKGTLSYDQFMSATAKWVSSIVHNANNVQMRFSQVQSNQTNHKCPKCGGNLKFKSGDKGNFWYCSNWNSEQKCSSFYNDLKGQPDTRPKVTYPCPACKQGELRLIKNTFWGCSRYAENCRTTFPNTKAGTPDFKRTTKRAG